MLCAICLRKMSCSFAANVNSQDSFLVLYIVIYMIVTQEVASYNNLIHEAGVVTIPQSTQ